MHSVFEVGVCQSAVPLLALAYTCYKGGRLLTIVERSAPITEVENFHHDVGSDHVARHELNHEVLCEVLRQPPVQDQETRLRSPLHRAHALFDQKDSLASPCSLLNVLLRQVYSLVRRNEVGVHSRIDIEKDDEDSIEALKPVRDGVLRHIRCNVL